jgi:hypothetical protein
VKSPADVSARLFRQWQVADNREALLLSEDTWPVSVPIGRPTPALLTQRTDEVRAHLQRWRAVGMGEVVWEAVSFRGGLEPVQVPVVWRLHSLEEWVAATGDQGVERACERLRRVLRETDPLFRRVMVRQRNALQEKSEAEVIRAAEVALQLSPGCAQGRPLRALSALGVDSKFFERNRGLLIPLLDARFDGQVSDVGLEEFLGALSEGDHWLLVVPLGAGLLPFDQQRVRASELEAVALPGSHVLIVENERCLHQLPALADTVAVLGAGLHLEWMRSARLGGKEIGYWGDLDTWGLCMLGRARGYQARLVPLLMTEEVFRAYGEVCAVVEPSPAGEVVPEGLTGEERELYAFLRAAARGRLEQEFLPVAIVAEALGRWREGGRWRDA